MDFVRLSAHRQLSVQRPRHYQMPRNPRRGHRRWFRLWNENGETARWRQRPGARSRVLHLAQGRHPEAVEEDALRTGLSLGYT